MSEITIKATKQVVALFERSNGFESTIRMLSEHAEKARKEAWKIVNEENEIPKGTKLNYNSETEMITELLEVTK